MIPLLAVINSPRPALILVVEDDVFQRMGAANMFADAGYAVLEAGDADEALTIFEANSGIEVLFTDANMSGAMNGSDLVREVALRWPRTGVIMTSGRKRPDMLPDSLLFHTKPYEPGCVLRQTKRMTTPSP